MPFRAWTPNAFLWNVAAPSEAAADLARQLQTSQLVAQVLINRGIDNPDEARAFLDPQLADLHDPADLPGAPAAARRIAQAVANDERIVIYGDYDVDGMTAVAILHAVLKLVGAASDYYVPHRLDEGYGVNAEAIDRIVAEAAALIVTVDCGISATAPLARAMAAGVDVIVTDHHAPPPELPEVAGIVHPALPGGQYANPDLSGAGVAFKLAWQVAREVCGRKRVDEPMKEFLLDATCLAALGTIADVVPLVGENRVLAVHGLRGLPRSRHPGLRALLASASLATKRLDAFDIGFSLAPRLNACGRMGHARQAIELLTTAAPDRCEEIVRHLADENTERRRIEREITAQAVEMVLASRLDRPESKAIVLAEESWHGGVIGICASRLVDKFHRPTVLIAFDGDSARGSGRSVPGLDMHEALAACSEHLIGFGGHAMAGGIRIEPGRIDEFAAAFAAYAAANLTERQLAPTIDVDAETTLAALSYKAVEHLSRLAPFGQGNREPVLAIRGCNVLVAPRRMGRTGQTVGMTLGQGRSKIRAVGFGMGDLAESLVGVNTVDVAATAVLNTFRGRTSVELHLKDVKWE